MRTFVLMSKLAPHGPSLIEVAKKVKKGADTGRQWVERAKEQCPEVKFLAHYALLGSYDFMDIYEAPNEEFAAKVSMICGADGTFHVESWTAIPDKRIAHIAEQLAEPEFTPDHHNET
ncbi:MAG: GYD family protein [Candidatus Zixiibacteriota bacterium]|nr:MAG: GYD family protein [candidate division Zixibacteria bacterium]